MPKYIVKTCINYDGKAYQALTEIELEDAVQIAALIAVGAVDPTPVVPPPAPIKQKK